MMRIKGLSRQLKSSSSENGERAPFTGLSTSKNKKRKEGETS